MIEGAPGFGSHLAKALSMLDETSPALWWSRSIGTPLNQRYRRSRRLLIGCFMAMGFGFVVALALSGYPAWRVAVLVGITVVNSVLLHFAHRVEEQSGLLANEVSDALNTLAVVALVWLTGGLRSPALPLVLMGIVPASIHYGAGRFTFTLVGLLVVVGVAMAIVPSAWLGPVISGRLYTASTLGFLLLAVVFTVDYVSELVRTLRGALRQMLRAREEVASQAMTRARDLELFSAKLSHELKNPLGAAKALVQLSARLTEDAEQRERLTVVESEVERIHAILKGYLSFSRPIESLRPERFALGEVLDDVLALLEARAAAAGVRLERQGDVELVGDPRRIKEALFNLVANAVEATPAKGEVTARVAARDGLVEVTIRDTGRGMPPEVLARLGTPFFTTRAEGTGLGVLLARSVFTQHGGTLELSSVLGQGTTATCRLPLTPRKDLDVACAAGG
jgi:signal transduction histidine kinase